MFPTGELASQVIAMPKDTNPNGDIFGGWLFSQMDLAACTWAIKISEGRAATVAVNNLKFIKPVAMGDLVTCFVNHVKTGNTSMTFEIEAWKNMHLPEKSSRVTSSTFIFVAIDKNNMPRIINNKLAQPKSLTLNTDMSLSPVMPVNPYPKQAPDYSFLCSIVFNLCANTLFLIIGCIAIVGLINLPLIASLPLIGVGLAGLGFFANSLKSLNNNELIDTARSIVNEDAKPGGRCSFNI